DQPRRRPRLGPGRAAGGPDQAQGDRLPDRRRGQRPRPLDAAPVGPDGGQPVDPDLRHRRLAGQPGQEGGHRRGPPRPRHAADNRPDDRRWLLPRRRRQGPAGSLREHRPPGTRAHHEFSVSPVLRGLPLVRPRGARVLGDAGYPGGDVVAQDAMSFDMLSAWFAHPVFLYTLAALPVCSAFLIYARIRRRQLTARLAASPLLRKSVGASPRMRRWKGLCLLMALLLLAVACAGPQWGLDRDAQMRKGRDVIIVLDLSRSMDAEQPSRRELAVRALRRLADTFEEHGGNRV